ncbi:hypothetical protein QUF51_13825 [Bacillus pumilus]|nr:hypothetical protein [Bacillus pumilus]
MWVYKYDDQFIYIPGEELLMNENDEMPENYTEIPPPVESYIAKYNPGTCKWKDIASLDYINNLKSKPLPNDLELLKKQNAFLTKQMTQILSMQKGDRSN